MPTTTFMNETEEQRRERELRERIAATGFTPEEEQRIAGAAQAVPAQQVPPVQQAQPAAPAATPAAQNGTQAAQPAAAVPQQPAAAVNPAPQVLTGNAATDYRNTYGRAAQTVSDSYNNLADTMGAAGAQMVTDVNAANDQLVQDTRAAATEYNRRAEALWQQYQDIITGQQARIDEANEQAERERRAALNASKWTGLTELAASIANLVGVGQFNAVHQQYNSVQNDWMSKAENDMRAHRSRIDNLNARLDDNRMRLLQLRQGDAQAALQNSREVAKMVADSKKENARAVYDTTLGQAQARAQGQQAAAQMEATGTSAAIDAQQSETNARIRSYGSSSGRGGSGSGSGNFYNISGGRTVRLTKETYDQGVRNAKGSIRQDVEKILADRQRQHDEALADDNLTNSQRRQMRKQFEAEDAEYNAVLDALRGTGDNEADNDVIDAFVERHIDELDNLGDRLAQLAGAAGGVTTARGTDSALNAYK